MGSGWCSCGLVRSSSVLRDHELLSRGRSWKFLGVAGCGYALNSISWIRALAEFALKVGMYSSSFQPEDLATLAAIWREWHTEHFALGDDSRPAEIKVAQEAQEFCDDPSLEEAADVIVPLLTWLDTKGLTVDDLLDAVDAKIHENMQRTWVRQPDGTFQHVEESDEAAD